VTAQALLRTPVGDSEFTLHPPGVGLTPEFSCNHTTTIAAKPHPKSACQLQRSLGSAPTRSGAFSTQTHTPEPERAQIRLLESAVSPEARDLEQWHRESAW
jgi:hypothetical protein